MCFAADVLAHNFKFCKASDPPACLATAAPSCKSASFKALEPSVAAAPVTQLHGSTAPEPKWRASPSFLSSMRPRHLSQSDAHLPFFKHLRHPRASRQACWRTTSSFSKLLSQLRVWRSQRRRANLPAFEAPEPVWPGYRSRNSIGPRHLNHRGAHLSSL